MNRKTLKELTLLDKFLFDETMDIPEAHEAVLRIVLGQEDLSLLVHSQTEKEVRTMPWLRSIRLDVFAVDTQGTIYDTEMQKSHRNDLAKRSRYYQGLIDSSVLEPGTDSFNALNNSCIILITPFDLFGKNRYCYTFVPCCKEDKEVELEDGAVRIFLNTKGTNEDEVSEELKEFLRYVETADGAIAESSRSENLKRIHACVSRIKMNEEMGVRYMQRWEEELGWKREGHEAGHAAGLAEGLERGLTAGLEKGLTQGRADSLRRLMETMGWTVEQAAAALQIPEEAWEQYRQLLAESPSDKMMDER